MKLSVLKENLKKITNVAIRFVSNKGQLPILSNLLLKAEKNKLHIYATNLESTYVSSIAAKIDEEGEIVVEARVLNEIINNLDDETVNLLSVGENLDINSGRFSSSIFCMNSSEFPKTSIVLQQKIFDIDNKVLSQGLLKTLFCVSMDETRPVLTGLLLDINQGEVNFVSTDGFRLSYLSVLTDVGFSDTRFIIPRNTILEILKIEKEDVVSFYYDSESKQLIFESGDNYILSRLIEGQFPDYKKIIPSSFVSEFSIDKYDLEKAVKLSSIFCRESNNILTLNLKDDFLETYAENQKIGKQSHRIDIKSIKESGLNGDLTVLFNYRFIEDLLKNIDSQDVEVYLSGQTTSAKFKIPTDNSFFHLIMPIKV